MAISKSWMQLVTTVLFISIHGYVDGQHYPRAIQNAVNMPESLLGMSGETAVHRKTMAFLGQGQRSAGPSPFSAFQGLPRLPEGDYLKEVVEDLLEEYNRDGFRSRLEADEPYNISETCMNHTMEFFNHLLAGEFWAYKMFDAFGKIPAGILSGYFLWSGDYDQCMSVEAVFPNSTEPQPVFTGRYCSVQSYVPMNIGPNGTKIPATQSSGSLVGLALQIGLCFPSSCHSQDVTELVKRGISLLPVSILSALPVNVVCVEDNDLSHDTRAIVSLCISGCIVVVLLLGTAYDLLIVQNCDPDIVAAVPEDDIGNPKIQKILDDESLPLITKTPRVENAQPQPGIGGKLLLSFSLYTNASKLLSTKQGEGTLRCLNGIRFLSMSWVILGHTFAFTLTIGENMVTYSMKLIGRIVAQPIASGTFSVDTFFFLSGLLVTYLTLKEMAKKDGKLNWFLYYFHRYWRLTPPMMLVMMVYIPMFQYWGSGPFWPQKGVEVNYCESTWWTNMLYVNNVVKSDQQCMGWGWYLANDMQFFVVSPLIILPLYYSGIAGAVVIGAFLLATVIAPGIISSTNQYGTGAFEMMAEPLAFRDLYIRPWCRMGPYLIGMALGYVFYTTKCKVHIPKLLVAVGWVAAGALGVSLVYGMPEVNAGNVQFSYEVSALINATSRTGWALAVAWVVFACCTGYGGFINRLLSWDIYVPLSRLTYCAYLVHPVIMFWYYYGQKHPIYMSDPTMAYFFLGNMVMSYGVAFVVSLAFEAPMMGLEKVLLRREKRS